LLFQKDIFQLPQEPLLVNQYYFGSDQWVESARVLVLTCLWAKLCNTTENGKNYLDQYLNSNDYCLNMSCEDNYLVVDGVMYFVELKNQNCYSFATYHSPDLTNKYEQIDAFVKIMELLKKRLSDIKK